MPDFTTKDALLERMVEQAVLLKQNIETMMSIINPVGVVQAFAGSTVPDGWLLCDGSAVSRTDYADLYAAIGDTYGDGDGSTTFNLPDLADKFIQGNATAGTVKSAGLPNITGTIVVSDSQVGNFNTATISGALGHETQGEVCVANSGTTHLSSGGNSKITFDASKSNAIYGNSTTVQPPALTLQYIIKY